MNDAPPSPALDRLLEEFLFPARVWSLIERRGLVTLRDAVALAPAELLTEKNVGRTSIADLRAVIESVTGTSWEEARAALRVSAPPDVAPDEAAAPPWVRLRNRLDPTLRAVALSELPDLPTRTRNFAVARGITTVGEFLDLPPESLRAAPNLGRKSLADTFAAIASLRAVTPETIPSPPSPPTLDDYPDLAALWRGLLGTLDRIDRMVLQHRSGLGSPVATLAELGEMLGVSRERIRQIESRAVRVLSARSWWVDALRARLDARLTEGCIALVTLAAHDPWFAPITTAPELFAFLDDRFFEHRYALVRIDGTGHLARFSQVTFDLASKAIDEMLSGMRWPVSRDLIASCIATECTSLGPTATKLLQQRAFAQVIADTSMPERLIGYGGTRDREILTWLRQEGRPVTVTELLGRFGRGRRPDGIVFVDRGVVTVPDLLDGFDALVSRVAERCAEHMRTHGAERQWSCAELVTVLGDEPALPPWFGPWPLAGLLQRSDRVRYLGRGIVVLPEVEGERLHLRALLVGLLRSHGAPLSVSDLRARATERRAIANLTFDVLLQRAPFVETAPDMIGLLERDVPGSEAAIERATGILVGMLETRGCGMSIREALRRLRASDAVFESWTEALVRSICVHDARLLTSASRAVGLAEWGSPRVPTRREVVAQALADGNGRAPVEVVRERIEALYEERGSRQGLAWTAWHLDARLEGDFIIAREDEVRTSRLPSLLVGVPEGAAARFEALLGEDLPREDLALAVQAHVRRFFMDAVTNDAIDLSQVLEAQRLCERLLAAEDPGDELRPLANAAIRYFVLSDDGAWDFAANGLDDDLAILRAVTARLEVEQAKRGSNRGGEPAE